LCHKVSSKFLKTNAPDPHNWILCFHAFLSVWVHLGPFRYHIKLRAKRVKLVQLMQKFVPQCLVRIFCNECLRSTPLDPKLMFWSISFHLGAFERPFGYCTKLGAKWANLVQLKQKFVPQSLIRNSQNECSRSTYWTLSSCFHAFLSIWVHLGPFCYHAKLKAKRAILVQLMQKFVRIFATNAPDPHHWTLNSCFGAFLSVQVHFGPFR